MDATSPQKHIVRSLYDWEILEARRVFGTSLKYDRVRVHENATWTNAMDRLGRRLKRMPALETHNAITLGNHCFFPVRLPDRLQLPGDGEHYKVCWLVHELTHAWQYQHMGWIYLVKALSAQFRQKGSAYDFGHADGLKKRRKEGWDLRKFNLEQQGDIARSYYERLCRGEDVAEWLPYIDELQDRIRMV